jgi:hypothetical protein
VASLQQKIDERASNVSGPAGDEDAMRKSVLGTTFCGIRDAIDQKKSTAEESVTRVGK